jgi:23S rRNA pseudouridine2605 synthase
MRLARAISQLGVASRRAAEELIAQGRVSVNDEVVATPAVMVDPNTDRISVDGKLLEHRPSRRYLALNKPVGVVSTVSDPHAERSVVQLVPSSTRLYPVGRLDKDSEGLILLTNDGDFANVVTHPRYETEKEYLALVHKTPEPDDLELLRKGVELDGQLTAPARVEIDHRERGGVWLRLVIHEGRNREVRRMLAAIGHDVQRLIRTRIGPVTLGSLESGQYRPLTPSEIRTLQQPGARRVTTAHRRGSKPVPSPSGRGRG